jgi:hypothetical protein
MENGCKHLNKLISGSILMFLGFNMFLNVSAQEIQKSNSLLIGTQYIGVTEYEREQSKVSFHMGYSQIKIIPDTNHIQDKAMNKKNILSVYLQMDRLSVPEPYKYSTQKDHVDYQRVFINFEVMNRIFRGYFNENVNIMFKFGLSVTPYFKAWNYVNGKEYVNNVDIHLVNPYFGYAIDFPIRKNISMQLSAERYIYTYFDRPYDYWYEKLIDIHGKTFFYFKWSLVYDI